MSKTIRRQRTCEVCEQPYKPNYHYQRTCGRVCGSVLQRSGYKFGRRQVAMAHIRTASRGSRGHRVWYVDHDGAVSNGPPTECYRCGVEFTASRSSQIHCSRTCKERSTRLRRRANEAGATGEYSHSQFMSIAHKFGYCCAYCNTRPDRLDADHVVPLSRGGSNTMTNLLPSCLLCNSDKRDLSLSDWALDRKRRGLPSLTTWWDESDGRYTHLSISSPSTSV